MVTETGFRPRARQQHSKYGPLVGLYRYVKEKVASNSYLSKNDLLYGDAFDPLDDKEGGSWDDFGQFEEVAEIAIGFLNATQVTYGGSRTTC